MKRKLMALMLAGIMVIQSAGISWATEFTDGVNEEYGDSSENGNEEAFSDEQTETEDLEDDSPEKDLTEESEDLPESVPLPLLTGYRYHRTESHK